MTHEDYVTYEQAVKLKVLGFKYPCNHYYSVNGGILHEETENDQTNYIHCNTKYLFSAPTLAQAQRWLREELGIDIVVRPRFNSNTGERVGYFWQWPQRTDVNMSPKTHKSYESALSDAISTILKTF